MRILVPACLSVATLLTACGGGGGTSATLAPFTQFSAVPSGAFTQAIDGFSQEAAYTFNSGTSTVGSLATASAATDGAVATLAEDSGGRSSMVLRSAQGTTGTYRETAGATFNNLTTLPMVYASDSAGSEALLASPATEGWDYQTFGVWLTGEHTGGGQLVTASVGAATPDYAIPTTGNAVYTGFAGGIRVKPTGDLAVLGADMTAAVDFAGRSVAFSTTNTINVDTTSAAEMNLSGTLTYAPAVNRFTGNVSTVGGGVGNAPLTGTATGKFYGPTAQEMGGTFSVGDGTLSGYVGGFGGKR